MRIQASTVEEYLAALPEDRRAALQAIRTTIKKHLDKGFEEGLQYGAIGYYVPHRIFPPGYHCDPKQPLPWAGLGAQKHHLSMGFMSLYMDPDANEKFMTAWKKAGKKLDMGKCCIRFKKLEDVPLDVVADVVKKTTAAEYVATYQRNLDTRQKPSGKRSGAKKAATKAPATKKATGAKAATKKPGAAAKAGSAASKKAAAKKRR